MSITKDLHAYVNKHPGVTSRQVAEEFKMDHAVASNTLTNLRRGGYVRIMQQRFPDGGRYYKYYTTSKYVPQKGRLRGTTFHRKNKNLRKKVGSIMRSVDSSLSLPIAVKANGSHAPVMSNRVGIALTMDGKQIVVPVRAAKEVYIQLKEIFS